MKEYTEIHSKSKSEIFIDSADRILLVVETSSLFAADVSYCKSYYESFHSPWWKRKIEKSSKTNGSPLYELFSLVQFLTIDRHEIYTLGEMCNFCQQLTTTEENSAKVLT